MAIIQISKIQVRSGNLVDLPQLDDAEFGWASDARKLYIGKTTPNENIEILTSYSNIYFSQINGSYGNLNVTAPIATGQTFAYDRASNSWINTGGNALDPGNTSYYSNTPIHLGNVSNVKMGGGAIGYVLETDGTGNLNWTPKGTIAANISNATQANPVVVTTATENFFVDGMRVTITDVNGMTQLNGNTYYANVLSSNTFGLYSDAGLTITVDGTGYTAYSNGGRAIASAGSSGGAGAAGGATYSVQYNNGGISTGDANLQWNYTTRVLTITGTANITQNLNVTSNVTGGNLITSGVLSVTGNANIGNIGTGGLITAIGNIDGGNLNTANSLSVGGNANIGNIGTTGVYATTLSASGNANVGNLGTTGVYATTLSTSGNANVGNLGTGGLITATGNIDGGNLNTTNILSVGGNANVGNLGTTGVYASTLSASGNANVGNLGTAGLVTATGNITTSAQLVSSVATGTAPLSVTSTTRVTNLNVAYANVSDYEAVTLASAGTYYPTFVNNSATGNRALAANASFSANLANGGFTATTLIGNLNGNITTTEITTGANSTQGNITGNWVLTAGSKMQATYADLAEYYEADQEYEPGTVLEFGGDKEVTLAQDGTTRVAGVVSTDPAYVMNAGCPGFATPVALQGRVPCKVRGKVRKGDMMVSGGNGYARPWNNPHFGMVIGKALENFEGTVGVIEIAVGRL